MLGRLLYAAVLLSACVHGPVLQPTPGEPTFIQACISPLYPTGVYRIDGKCDSPVEITWELPVRYDLEPGLTPGQEAAMLHALDTWNVWLGSEVFVPAESGHPDVLLGVRPWPDHPDWRTAGVTRFTYEYYGMKWWTDVLLYGQYSLSHETIMHELGHVLGLDHDPDDERSLMFPSVNGDPSTLTVADCLALARKYDLHPPECT